MDITQLIAPEQVIGRLGASEKMALLRELASHAAVTLRLGSERIVDPIIEREKLGSTGIGHGFALPHARIAGLTRFFGMFVRLHKPIEFDAVDHEPVDLVFLLLSSETAEKAHLAALAAITRRLRTPSIAERLRRTRDPVELYGELTGTGESPSL